ncbi:MAG: alpha/beta hydrolase [Zetaproteobacteria bacterium]|nr:alpha/beta hydrolase [Zetaproteobacteria bacterium]
MILLFVHGYSTIHTDSYGYLPEALAAQNPALQVEHIYLGRYISFADHVRLDDISRAFDTARKDVIGEASFAAITHSTGGPVVRNWARLFFSGTKAKDIPLSHLIMLAPANHGSTLAILAKHALKRLECWINSTQIGEKVIEWLKLGSQGSLQVNLDWLQQSHQGAGYYPFVLTGQKIEHEALNYIDTYLSEDGSDGVVRTSSANLNFIYAQLEQQDTQLKLSAAGLQAPRHTPFLLLPKACHGGKRYGIMKSVQQRNAHQKPVVQHTLECLAVDSSEGYQQLAHKFRQQTQQTELQEKARLCTMLIFRIQDQYGNDDFEFELLLLAGAKQQPHRLPKGFFIDRQRNSDTPNCLTYYLDCKKMRRIQDQQLSIRISGFPTEGFTFYRPATFTLSPAQLETIFQPHQTVIFDICLHRCIDQNTMRFDPLQEGRRAFNHSQASGTTIPDEGTSR